MLKAIKVRFTALAARSKLASEDGQALVEYSMIMALVGMALVATLRLVSGDIENVVQTIIGVL
jgi:Flp pilus assembly pilin Flp